MKVLNLRCAHDHGFEGWFASEDDFLAQSQRDAIACPLCGSVSIARLPSAPRLNISGARAPQAVADSVNTATPADKPDSPSAELRSMWIERVREVLAKTEDVGERFPEEARRIHYGETGQRGIRGQASAQERAELADEGIEVVALPVHLVPKGSAH